MATTSTSEITQLKRVAARLQRAAANPRQAPWARRLMRRDLLEIGSALADLERGFGPNMARIPELLHRRRFAYINDLERSLRADSMQCVRTAVRSVAEEAVAA